MYVYFLLHTVSRNVLFGRYSSPKFRYSGLKIWKKLKRKKMYLITCSEIQESVLVFSYRPTEDEHSCFIFIIFVTNPQFLGFSTSKFDLILQFFLCFCSFIFSSLIRYPPYFISMLVLFPYLCLILL